MSYTQTADGGRLKITFDITPNLGTPIYVGDTVTITGTLWHNYASNDVKSLGVWIGGENVKYINTNIDRNVTKRFSLSFVMPVFEATEPGNYMLYFVIYNKSGGAGGGWTDQRSTDGSSKQYIYVTNYSKKIEIDKFDFTRSSLKNGAYVPSNEGTYGLCNALHIIADEDISSSDINVIRLTVYSGESEVLQKNLSYSIVRSAMTDEGYSESSPSLLSGFALEVINDYRFVLEIGKEGEALATMQDVVPRAFANMHLSGAKMGGVAFGGFSNSTDDDPKFESFYKGYFPAGFDEKTCKMIGNILYPIGSVYMNRIDSGPINLPEEIFGGEWVPISEGRVLVGAGNYGEDIYSPGDTGGSSKQQISIPSHHHRVPIVVNEVSGSYLIGVSQTGCVSPGTGSASDVFYTQAKRSSGSFSGIKYGNTSEVSGGSGSVNTMPPYLVVSIYERTKLYDPITGI